MYVDLGFFKDVLVPPHGLPDPSFWHAQDEVSGGWLLAAAGHSRLSGFGATQEPLGAVQWHHSQCCCQPNSYAKASPLASHVALLSSPSPCPQAWLWKVEGQDLFFEKGLPVRFKVQSVRFHDPPTLAEQQEQVRAGRKRQAQHVFHVLQWLPAPAAPA